MGAAIIAITVILGLVVIWRGFSGDATVETGQAAITTTSSVSGPDRNAPPTVTLPGQGTTLAKTSPTKVAPKDVKVLVANGVDPSKVIAGPNAEKLTAAGYTVVGRIDLPPPPVDKSAVYYSGELIPEAQAIAQALGISTSALQPMPSKPAVNLQGASVMVVIGKDKAP